MQRFKAVLICAAGLLLIALGMLAFPSSGAAEPDPGLPIRSLAPILIGAVILVVGVYKATRQWTRVVHSDEARSGA